MAPFDHMSVGVHDVRGAAAFYDGLLALLDEKRLVGHERFVAYGTDAPEVFVIAPHDGAPPTVGNGVRIAFRAREAEHVKAFHAYALAHGGSCEGPPGPREGYPRCARWPRTSAPIPWSTR